MSVSHENPPPAAETPTPAPAPPPAAALVAEGLDPAELLALRAELETERKARAAAESGRKSAETKAAEAERLAQELIAATKAKPDEAPIVTRRRGPLGVLSAFRQVS